MQILLAQFLLLTALAIVLAVSVNKKQRNNFFCVVSFISMWYIHSMVKISSVTDLPVYETRFIDVGRLSLQQIFGGYVEGYFEEGYLIATKICSSLGGDFRVYLMVYSFILLFLYVNAFRKYSPYVVISVLFLLIDSYNQSIYVIRQHLAIAIFIASFTFIIERKLWYFVLASIIMFSFHRTSLICVPLYFIYSLKAKTLNKGLIILAIVAYLGFGVLLSNYSHYFIGYEGYLTSGREGANATGLIVMSMMLVVYIIALRKDCFKEGINKLIFITLSLAVILDFVGIGFAPTGRLAWYFEATSVLALPLSMKYLKVPLKYVVCLLFMGMWFYKTFLGSASQYIERFSLVSLV